MTPSAQARRPACPAWIILAVLLPLMAGGVVVGDEANLLSLSRTWRHLPMGMHEFFHRAPYAFHQMPWFVIVHLTQKLVGALTPMALVTEAVVSAETVIAGLATCALVFTWLARRMDGARAALVMLGFFFGGYGLFVAFMGEAPECYMALLMAARLFAMAPAQGRSRAIALGAIDAGLAIFKIYSLIFVVLMLPLYWSHADRRQRTAYVATLAALVAILVAAKLAFWSPLPAYSTDLDLSPIRIAWRFAQSLISPWTGLLFCMPFLLTLFWAPADMRRDMRIKLVAIGASMAFFSLYVFFDADHPGGRYVFPFLIALVPEIAAGFGALTTRRPTLAFAVPLLLLVFLPVGIIGFPFYPGESLRTLDPDVPAAQRCMPNHPALFAWKMALAHAGGDHAVPVCLRGHPRVLDPDDAAIPRTGPGRVAFVLAGGKPHDYAGSTGPHRAMALHLRAVLVSLHLDSLPLWIALTLLPGLVLLGWALWAARYVARRRPIA